MNCSKVTPPLQILVDVFIYYSTIMLILSLLITPLQFYVILTKSKNLSTLKWLILNHSFWCLFFELGYTIVKPMNLAPAIAGYSLGFPRNGSFKASVYGTAYGGVVLLFQAFSLGSSIVYRYFYAFPSKITEIIKMKYVFWGIVLGLIFGVSGYSYAVVPYITMDIEEAHKAAIEFDPCFSIYFNKSAFVFFPITESAYAYTKLTFYAWLFCFCSVIFMIFLFIFLIFYHKKSASIAKLQKSLIISALAQASIFTIFLFCPNMFGVVTLYFQIPNITNYTLIGSCIVSTHCFLEAVATLYFIAPYRKAVKSYFAIIFPKLKVKPKPNLPSQPFPSSSVTPVS